MATDLLPLSGGAMSAPTACDAIGPRLTEVLTRASDAHEAAQFICADETLLSEARHILPLVQRHAKGLVASDVRIVLQRLLLLFDPPSFGRGQEASALEGAWEHAYVTALTGLPREALEHAVAEWCKVGKTFPKPAHLRELADPVAKRVALIAWRLRKAVERGEAQWREKPAQTPEERQEMRDRLQALTHELGARRPAQSAPLGRSAHEAAERLRRMA